LEDGKPVTYPAFWKDTKFNHGVLPVVGIGWYEALAFVTWLKRVTDQPWRLLTEVEWEAAAPTAGDPLSKKTRRINCAEMGIGHPWVAAGMGMESWCGASNMRGNVWEWTSSRWGHNWQSMEYPYPYDPADGREDLDGSAARVMRGGSYFDPVSESHPANRGRFLPGSRASNIGFRIGYSV
jgi:formylglycine-generating enzyme required for sulfatase activity